MSNSKIGTLALELAASKYYPEDSFVQLDENILSIVAVEDWRFDAIVFWHGGASYAFDVLKRIDSTFYSNILRNGLFMRRKYPIGYRVIDKEKQFNLF